MATRKRPERTGGGRLRRVGIVITFFIVIFVLPALISFGAEWMWFQAVGFERVLVTRLVARWLLGLVVGGFAFAFLLLNVRIALRGVPAHQL
jgi:uncharacterized membrane protein (UPF0182 family)